MKNITFPTVSGSNLLRQKLTLPQDLQGELNLVFIPFQQWQQSEVDSWVTLAGQLEESYKGLYYYELPTIQSKGVFYRRFINEGMRAGIPNPKSRERTITLYLDKPEFRAALSMLNEDHIYILLIDGQGNEFFRARGPYSVESETALRQTLEQMIRPERG